MLLLVLVGAAVLTAASSYNTKPYSGYGQARRVRSLDGSDTAILEVDLGYNIYRGYENATTNIHVYKG